MESLFLPHGAGTRAISDAAFGMLGACSEIVARWFSVMRDAVMRERSRQVRFKEDNGLPKSAKIPYIPPPLTDSDMAISALSESVIRAMFGDAVADYAKEKFSNAIATGDMRSFKIRLVILKARDSIQDRSLREDFSAGADECIDSAETKAGCRQDNSERRLSRKEQERKKLIDSIRAKRRTMQDAQMELPLIWNSAKDDSATNAQSELDTDKCSIRDGDEECPYAQNVLNSISCNRLQKQYGEEVKTPVNKAHEGEYAHPENVTVTGEKRYCNGYCNAHGILRKTGPYSSVEEILNDIEDGAVTPYESQEEIISDMEDGFLSPEEAILFTAAMDHYSPEDVDVQEEDFEEDNEDEDGDGLALEDEDRDVGGAGFSYDPNGFGGCEDDDDEWR